MKTVVVTYGQTLIDITLQELGDAERLFEVAELNGISITDALTLGSTILVPDFDLSKKKLVKLFADPFNKPASSTGFAVPADFWNFPAAEKVTLENFVPLDQKKVKVEEGQTLIDIVIQELGDAERLFEIAALNNLGITDTLAAGSFVIVPAAADDKKGVTKIFSDPTNKPASNRQQAEEDMVLQQGIGYWAVNLDFIVS